MRYSDRLRILDVPSYLVFHNVAEFFSVMVSLSIFWVAWYSHEQSSDRHSLFLGTIFLGIGLLDFMHTLGYSGMPAFITQNSPLKSTQYWIAARLFVRTPYRFNEIYECLTRHLGLQFIYADAQPAETTNAEPLTAERLSVLPQELRNELRDALERDSKYDAQVVDACVALFNQRGYVIHE